MPDIDHNLISTLTDRIARLEAQIAKPALLSADVTAVDPTAGTATLDMGSGVTATLHATSGAPFLPAVGSTVMVTPSGGDVYGVAPRQMVSGDLVSSNWSPGVSGWSIDYLGNAEFNDITVRGVFETGSAGQRVEVSTDAGIGAVRFYSGDLYETAPASIFNTTTYSSYGTLPEIDLVGPTVSGQPSGSISLRSKTYVSPYAADTRAVMITADELWIVPTGQDLLGAWRTTTPTLASGWAIGSTGTNIQRYMQIGKTVHVRGRVKFGGTGIAAGAGPLYVSLPAPPETTDQYQLGGSAGQTGSSTWWERVQTHTNYTTGGVGHLLTFNGFGVPTNTAAAGDFTDYTITYEAA